MMFHVRTYGRLQSVIRLYAVPMDTFTGEAEEPPIEEEAPEEEE